MANKEERNGKLGEEPKYRPLQPPPPPPPPKIVPNKDDKLKK